MNKEPFIEVINCPNRQNHCSDKIAKINEYIDKSREYAGSRDVDKSIAYRFEAFKTIQEHDNPNCESCNTYFKKSIYQSTLSIMNDFQRKQKFPINRKLNASNLEITRRFLNEMEKMAPDIKE